VTANRLAILIVVIPVLALCAGIAAGMLVVRAPSAAEKRPAVRGPSLSEELNLSSEQRQQMREIWEKAQAKVDDAALKAQRLQQERDDAMLALLDAEGRRKFAEIAKDFSQRDAALLQDRDNAFTEAVARTKEILSPQQWERYDRILSTQVRGGAGGSPAIPQTSPKQIR
jgi:hypothetical protein